MATTSTMALFRAQLVTSLRESNALDGVQISYGEPSSDALRRETIWLDSEVTGSSEEPNLKAGRRTRNEEYSVKLHISVASKTSVQTSEARAVELFAAVEDVLAADPATSVLTTGTSILAHWVSEFEMDTTEIGAEHPATTITLTITVKARLT